MAIEGDSPVHEEVIVVKTSRTGHVLSCLKMGGPSSKAKYSWLTDSEPVPWGKGEKNPCKGSEIEPETVYVQAVGVSAPKFFYAVSILFVINNKLALNLKFSIGNLGAGQAPKMIKMGLSSLKFPKAEWRGKDKRRMKSEFVSKVKWENLGLRWLRTFCIMGQRLTLCSKVNRIGEP